MKLYVINLGTELAVQFQSKSLICTNSRRWLACLLNLGNERQYSIAKGINYFGSVSCSEFYIFRVVTNLEEKMLTALSRKLPPIFLRQIYQALRKTLSNLS